MIVSQSQVVSLIAFHFIRAWPTVIPPNLSHILCEWIKHSSADFDDFGLMDIPDNELRSYLAITLNQDSKFMKMRDLIDCSRFFDLLCKSILEEVRELVE